MLLLYNFVLRLYRLAISFAAWFDPKARQWIEGRKSVAQHLQQLDPLRPTIWMHCASLGEFEQGRPVLEAIRQRFPEYQILLSFFSPSGYEIRKNYPGADVICYLPLDSARAAQNWVSTVQPRLAIFVKYEFWHHYLQQLQIAQCPTILIAASFRPKQLFFRSYGVFFRSILERFQHIFVQEGSSEKLLREFGISSVSTAGDTRVDRVCQIAREAKTFPLIQRFVGNQPLLILGSSWSEEEDLLIALLKDEPLPDWKYLIAPHQISEKGLQRLEKKLCLPTLRYSKASIENVATASVLLIDNIGMLSALYRYGQVAFIGGGFGKGIHNILEPIAFGLPVLFGPKFQKFTEAVSLENNGGAFCVHHLDQLKSVMQRLQQEPLYRQAANETKNYLKVNRGATELIMDFLETRL